RRTEALGGWSFAAEWAFAEAAFAGGAFLGERTVDGLIDGRLQDSIVVLDQDVLELDHQFGARHFLIAAEPGLVRPQHLVGSVAPRSGDVEFVERLLHLQDRAFEGAFLAVAFLSSLEAIALWPLTARPLGEPGTDGRRQPGERLERGGELLNLFF